MSVAWVGVGVMAAGTIASSIQADKANKRGIEAATNAAELERQTALDTLEYYRGRDSQMAGLQAQANAIAGRVANSQVALMDQQREQSDQYFQRLKNTFWPLEDGLVSDAEAYDTPARREEEAGTAMADVDTQMAITRSDKNRTMLSMGVDPSSAKFGRSANQDSITAAAAKASAGNTARNRVEDMGWARRYDAAALGRNLPNNSTSAANASTGAGSVATSAAYAPVTAANAQTAMMGSAMQNYGNSLTSAADRIAGVYNNQAAQWGNAASGFASIGGSMMGMALANKKG
jgi:hypothetical protein